MTQPESPKRQPYWLWKTKRLFPHPLFAGCISVACLIVGLLLAMVAFHAPVWPMGVASVLFFAGAYATAAAAVTKSTTDRVTKERHSAPAQTNKPTFAILVLLTSVYSWFLTLAMHLFDAFFRNGPGSTKYFVTLGIAIASTLFMRVYGRQIIRQHFGAMGGRNLVLNSGQVGYVVIFVMCCSVYLTWLLS